MHVTIITLIIIVIQEDADIGLEAKSIGFPQPAIILRGNFFHPRDAFLVIEGQMLCKVPLLNIPYVLLCAFYSFNMQYTYSCNNFYSFLEYYFLNGNIVKRSKLQHFITCLNNITV